jgi:hypothetical protein
MPVIPLFGRLKQFHGSLNYVMRPSFKKKQKNTQERKEAIYIRDLQF